MNEPLPPTGGSSLRHALAIALSAFLLFQVQPLIASWILPWFGGTPNVWTTCLLFFQGVLLAGYAYAFALNRLPVVWQSRVHLALLAVSVLLLPIAPSDAWKPESPDFPAPKILLLLLATVGGPYFVLSANAPLVQSWFARELPGRSPYRLYALSNAASFLGLLLYPFLVQPLLDARAQAWSWSALYLVFAGAAAWCAWEVRRADAPASVPVPVADATATAMATDGGKPAPAASPLLWLLLSACGSAVMLGKTNDLTHTLAAVPFLWVLPLALYLASFIVTFEKENWYRRSWWMGTFLLFALVTSTWGQVLLDARPPWLEVLLDSGTVLTACVICHGELVRARPPASRLTSFYLAMAAGGAFGGVFVALLAPTIFSAFWEVPIALLAILTLFGLRVWWDPASSLQRGARPAAWAALIGSYLLLASGIAVERQSFGEDVSRRNFYGVLRLTIEEPDTPRARRTLYHGWTSHGSQFLAPEKSREHVTYFGPESGLGVAIRAKRGAEGRPLRVGIIGLGAGAMATWTQAGDEVVYYEINPISRDFARDDFTFLKESPASIDVVLGDARISIERALRKGERLGFDLLVLDAFTGGSIPTHLLTREALALYREAIVEDGALVLHISNRHLDLERPVAGAARALGFDYARVHQPENLAVLLHRSEWLVLSRDHDFLAAVRTSAGDALVASTTEPPILWTDQRTSLLPIIR